MADKKSNVDVKTFGNLNQDSPLVSQPKGTTRFVLNGVNESNEGDLGVLSVEEGNELSSTLPENFIPLGSVSINKDESLIFLGDGVNSILLVKKKFGQTIVFDDRQQTNKLGLSLDKKVDATYRLRKGCERTVYWVDPIPRFFILERPDKFKKDNGEWNINSFSLFRTIQEIPKFEDINVNSSGGSLPSGSYIVSAQYLDNDFNPTEFITSAQPVRVFTDNLSTSFRSIRGSSSKEEPYYTPEVTAKSFTVELSNLDTENYPFYRLAISEVNTGSGLISEVKYTNEIPTTINKFTYTGNNFGEIGTQEEVAIFNLIINEAEHIDQLDNQLLLSSVKGDDSALCNLQKYASKIQADCEVKRVNLTLPTGSNPKNPSAALEGLGYMPGEIYSYGIVWILEGNIISPTFHIPGKNPALGNDRTFTQGSSVYPMKTDNQCADAVYTDNSSCDGLDYWGLDSQGQVLLNQPIRHHRFPFRSDIGLSLVERQDFNAEETETWQLKIEMFGTLQIPECPPDTPDCEGFTLENTPDIVYEITYAFADESGNPIAGTELTVVDNIDFLAWDNDGINDVDENGNPAPIPGALRYSPSEITEHGLVPVSVKETVTYPNGTVSDEPAINFVAGEATSTETGINYKVLSIPTEYFSEGASYTTNILGIKFSNIEIPKPEDVGGKKVIGYFFVRNQRVEEEKTIVDTGVIGPSLKNKNFVSHSHLMPEMDLQNEDRIDKRNLYLINPEFKFNNKTYTTFNKIVKQGEYEINQRLKSRVVVEDVAEGTSYSSKRHKSSERDNDGWQLHVRTRQNKVDYNNVPTKEVLNQNTIKRLTYLDALGTIKIEEENQETLEYWNLVTDNKIGVIECEQDYSEDFLEKIDYVALERTNANPYANFRSTSYIKISQNYHEAGQPESVEKQTEFGGDTYVSPMSITNSVFWDDVPRKRRTKGGLFVAILGGLLILAGAAVAIFTFGLGLPVAIALGSAGIAIGATAAAAGIRQENYNKAYKKLWKEGLRDTVLDNFIESFKGKNPRDDEFQWVGEMTTLFFESSVNCYLRHGVNKTSDTDFINAPALYESGNTHTDIHKVDAQTTLDSYMVQKLTYFEPERNDQREYLGFALPELYVINKDYLIENTQKLYEHLPIEYDCCSDCLEDFPHRIHHSLQSFEEEITDNFQVFLPNNYKDIQGNTGVIKNIFTIKNNLYAITEHALWHLPQNFQERVTDSIVSFIGTGEYFATPPRKIVDDDINSAGTSFKWGVLKTRNGVIIITERENKIYLFNGNELKPISNEGLSAYFRNSLQLLANAQHYENNETSYPYLDNTSKELGIGYIVAYDTTKERFIITKKDFIITNLPENPYLICDSVDGTVIFENYLNTISQKESEGFTYLGLEDCQMVFFKYENETETQDSYDTDSLEQESIESFATISSTDTSTQYTPGNTIPFFTTSGPVASQFDLPNNRFIAPYTGVINFLINVPLNFAGSSSPFTMRYLILQGGIIIHTSPYFDTPSSVSYDVLVEVIGGRSITIQLEFGTPPDIAYTLGIRSWSWIEKQDRDFTLIQTPINVQKRVVERVDGVPFIPNKINASWTLSYSLKSGGWVSWHSYLPDFYLNETERFYSWKNGLTGLWKHNIKGKYQSYYGEIKPFIVEFVSNSSLTTTKIWDAILYQAECKMYDSQNNQFIDVNETFNKGLFYNSNQISGVQNIVLKTENSGTMLDQITEFSEEIIVDRNERDYTLNNIRDYRDSMTEPLFKQELEDIQANYFIDREVNEVGINLMKDWTQLESFRDKYLVVRLIFDTFDNRKLTVFFSMEDIKPSER